MRAAAVVLKAQDTELAEKDKQLAAAKEALHLSIAAHSTDERQIERLMRHYLAEASGPQEAGEGGNADGKAN